MRWHLAIATGVALVAATVSAGAQPAAPPPPPLPPSVTTAPALGSASTPAPPQLPPGGQPATQGPGTQAQAQVQAPAPPPPPPSAEPEFDSRPTRRRGVRDPRPRKLEWRPGEVIPPGYESEEGPSKRFLVGGIITLGTLYLGSSVAAYVAVFGGDTELAPMFIPVAGPFISIGTAETDGTASYLLVLNGLGQAAGLAMALVSAFERDAWLRRLPTGVPLEDEATAPRLRASVGLGGGSMAIDF